MIDFRDADLHRCVILTRRDYVERIAYATATGFVAGVILTIIAWLI